MQAKNEDLNEEIRELLAFKPFQDRWSDIVAYRGAISNRKRFSMVHWIIGKLYAKNPGPEMRK